MDDGSAKGSGSRYLWQDDKGVVPKKGLWHGADGNHTAAGATTDFIKVTWKNGKIVSVETWDANESNAKVFDPDTTAKTVSNKMDPQGKGQTQNVVYVAKSQAEGEAIRDRFVSNKNVRVIFPDNQFDTHRLQPLIRKVPGGTLTVIPGEQAGKTPRTPTVAEPETRGGGGRMGKITGAFGVVGELFTIYGAMRDYQYWEKTGCDPTGLMGPCGPQPPT